MLKAILMALFVFILLTIGFTYYQLSGPRRGDWLCWAGKVGSHDKGTYGWSRNKERAQQVSIKLCEDEFDPPCEITYCERY